MIIYDHYYNAILVETLRIKGAAKQFAATTKIHAHLKEDV